MGEIAATLKLLPRKLRPGDRFGDDVGTYMLTSDELDTLTELGEKRAKWPGIDVQLRKMRPLRLRKDAGSTRVNPGQFASIDPILMGIGTAVDPPRQ